MRIVQSADVKLPECTHQRMDGSGFLTADLNGDGIADFAALLISRVPKRIEKWEGKDWPVHQVRLVVLLGQKDGSFQANTLYEHEDFLPTIYGLRVQPPTELREVGTERRVSLSKPGIILFACEKFSVVHFYEGGSFKSLGIDG